MPNWKARRTKSGGRVVCQAAVRNLLCWLDRCEKQCCDPRSGAFRRRGNDITGITETCRRTPKMPARSHGRAGARLSQPMARPPALRSPASLLSWATPTPTQRHHRPGKGPGYIMELPASPPADPSVSYSCLSPAGPALDSRPPTYIQNKPLQRETPGGTPALTSYTPLTPK